MRFHSVAFTDLLLYFNIQDLLLYLSILLHFS